MPYFNKSGHYDNFPADGCKVGISEGDGPFSKSHTRTFQAGNHFQHQILFPPTQHHVHRRLESSSP